VTVNLPSTRNEVFFRPQERTMSTAPKPEGATTVFVLGLLSLILCAPLGIVAWLQGNSYLERCRSMNVTPDGLGVAGRILGIIGTCLFCVGLAISALALCAGIIGTSVGH
jgi:hypothetical protein